MTPDGWEPMPLVHVERSDDPCELHWVCDAAALAALTGACEPPVDSPLGELLAARRISGLRIEQGEIIVRVPQAECWPNLAPDVDQAVKAELRDGARRLARHIVECPPTLPSRAEVQHVIDRAVGGLAAGHGGAIEVLAVGPGVVLRLTGACDGCRSGDVSVAYAASAIHRVYPQLGAVEVAPPPCEPIAAPVVRKKRGRRARGRSSDGCH